MKSVSSLPTNKRSVNLQLASFVCGLALASITFIGAGEILKHEHSSTPQASPQMRVAIPVMPEPDFGSFAADYLAFEQLWTAPRVIDLVVPEPDFGLVPADYSAFRPSTEGRSGQSVVDPDS